MIAALLGSSLFWAALALISTIMGFLWSRNQGRKSACRASGHQWSNFGVYRHICTNCGRIVQRTG